MQNFIVSKLFASVIAVISFFFLTSCLNDVDNSQPTQFQIGMEIQNFDSTFTAGDDAMYVGSVQFVVDSLRFETDGEPIQLNNSATVIEFVTQPTPSQNPNGLVGGRFPTDVTYDSLAFTFPKAPEGGSGNFGQEFYGDDGKRFTIIAEGTFNDSSFTYRSERVFVNSFPLSLSTIPEEDAFFTFLIQTDVRTWFLNGQALLDPADPGNTPQINDNIGQSFRLEQDSSVGNQSL